MVLAIVKSNYLINSELVIITSLHQLIVSPCGISSLARNLESLNETFPQDQKLNDAAKYWDTMPHGCLLISPCGMQEEKAFYEHGEKVCAFEHLILFLMKQDYVFDRLRPSFYETGN